MDLRSEILNSISNGVEVGGAVFPSFRGFMNEDFGLDRRKVPQPG